VSRSTSADVLLLLSPYVAYHGQASFDIFSHHKSVLNKTTKFDLAVRYPPYSDSKLSFIQMLS
jgi:hypothetical protein